MAFLQSKVDTQEIKDSSGSFIGKSDIYDLTIKTVSVDQGKNGGVALNFNVDYNGNETVLYGLRLKNNDGSDNFQMATFKKLCLLAGAVDAQGDIFVEEPSIETHKLGKDQTPTDLAVLTEFSDFQVKIKVQNVYSLYQGEVKQRKEIRGFYRYEDGATPVEVINGVEPKQYLKDKETVADILKDGVTEEQVEEFLSAKSGGSSTPKSAPAKAAPKSNPFAKAN